MRLGPLLVLVLPALAARAALAADAAPLRLFSPSPATGLVARALHPGTVRQSVDRAALDGLRDATNARVVLPLPDGREATLALARFELLDPGATVTTTDERGSHPLAVDAVVFKGAVEGEPGSLAVITVSGGTLYAAVSAGAARYSVVPVGGAGEHRIADERVEPVGPRRLECEVGDPDRSAAPSGRARPERANRLFGSVTQLECRYAVDCDYEFYANTFGSNASAATAYLMTVYATASGVYERDIGTTIRITYLNFWTTPADPYTASDGQGMVAQMATYWGANRDAVVRDLAGLVSGRVYSGFGYYDGLCSHYKGYASYGILGYFTYPTNATTWDAYVVCHEMGHNFGSGHTQSCVWQTLGWAPPGGLLDSCVAPNPSAGEGNCYSGPTGIIPPDLGTIMSYCPLDQVRLEFHVACKAVMRAGAEGSCMAVPAVQGPRDFVATAVAGGTALNWNPSLTAGVIRYDVFRSNYMVDYNPPLLGSTTGTVLFDPVPGGNPYYKVRAVRAADQSPFTGERRAAPCAPGSPASYAAGSSPAALLAYDFNRDGFTDVAIANAAGNDVSVLLAQRCQVCTVPFEPAVSYAVGSGPAGLAAADWNGDGYPDLAVANHGSSSVSVLLGEGVGSQAYGSFAAAVSYPVSGAPSGLVAGDFDEDGIEDLAVACAGGTVDVLRGLGADGVGNGTFASPVSFPLASDAYGLAAGDFNHDGVLDLVAACGDRVRVLLGNGTGGRGDGSFSTGVPYDPGAGADARWVACGDLDHDGILDLAVAVGGGATPGLWVLRGNGTGGAGDGTFTSLGVTAGVAGSERIALGDWNQDGNPDAAIPSPGTNAVLVYDGAGNGGFAPARSVPAGVAPRGVAAVDLTDDNRPDLVVAGGSAGTLTVVPVSCAGPSPFTLQITSPNGGETLTYPNERTIAWTKGAGVQTVDVQVSRDAGAHWQTVGRNLGGTSFTWSVTPPTTSQGRVRVVDPTVPTRNDASDASFYIIPSSALGVVEEDRGLALLSVGPNPAAAEVTVWLSLADPGRADLALLDVGGRVVARRDLEGAARGPQRIVLARATGLPAGLYFVRLAQGRRAVVGRVAVVH